MTRAEWAQTIRVLDDLPTVVRRERLARGESIRSAARQIGISFSTLDRFERRQVGVQLKPVRAILVWLSGDAPDYGPTPCDPSSDHDPDL